MNPLLAQLAPSLIRQVHALKRPSSVDLSLGEPSLHLDNELRERAERRYAAMSPGYTPNLGLMELREAIARYHQYEGLTAAANVAVTVGSQHALYCVFTCLLSAGDEVVIFDPAYPAYEGLAKLCGATARRVLLSGEFRWTAEQLQSAVTPRTKIIVLSAPSNPLGLADDPTELRKLADWAKSRDIWLVSDEIYRELYFKSPPLSIATLFSRTIVVGGLSKSCAMTGQRLGFVLAPAQIVTAIWPLIQLSVTCAPTFAQCLALEAFNEPRFMQQHRAIYAARWQHAKQVLDEHGVGYVAPDGAFYVVCKLVPEGEDALAFCKRVVSERDVVIVPGTAFGQALKSHVRLSFAGESENFSLGIQRLLGGQASS